MYEQFQYPCFSDKEMGPDKSDDLTERRKGSYLSWFSPLLGVRKAGMLWLCSGLDMALTR